MQKRNRGDIKLISDLNWSLLINKSAVCTFSRLLWLTPITMKISEN